MMNVGVFHQTSTFFFLLIFLCCEEKEFFFFYFGGPLSSLYAHVKRIFSNKKVLLKNSINAESTLLLILPYLTRNFKS